MTAGWVVEVPGVVAVLVALVEDGAGAKGRYMLNRRLLQVE